MCGKLRNENYDNDDPDLGLYNEMTKSKEFNCVRQSLAAFFGGRD